jgi:hypothetical protein
MLALRSVVYQRYPVHHALMDCGETPRILASRVCLPLSWEHQACASRYQLVQPPRHFAMTLVRFCWSFSAW